MTPPPRSSRRCGCTRRFRHNAALAPGPRFDEEVDSAQAAPTAEEVQQAAAAIMRILVNAAHIVVPLGGLFRICAMANDVELADSDPSFTSQSWITRSKRAT